MRKRSQRLWLIGGAAVLMSGAVALAAVGFKDSFAYSYTPSELVEKNAAKEGHRARVGGLVEAGSVHVTADAQMVFRITDGVHFASVTYDSLKPDMFGEGRGVVAEGKFDAKGVLIAEKLITSHDKSYLAKEQMDKLKKNGAEAGLTDKLATESKPAFRPVQPGTIN